MLSIISEATYNKLWLQGNVSAIQESQVKLKTYSGKQLSVKGVTKVEVQYSDQCEQLQLAWWLEEMDQVCLEGTD